jgi:hypothetical protein
MFARNLGATLGASLFGAVLNYGLAANGAGRLVSSTELRRLLDSPAASEALLELRQVLDQSLHLTFWAMFVISIIVAWCAWLVPPTPLGRVREAPAE